MYHGFHCLGAVPPAIGRARFYEEPCATGRLFARGHDRARSLDAPGLALVEMMRPEPGAAYVSRHALPYRTYIRLARDRDAFAPTLALRTLLGEFVDEPGVLYVAWDDHDPARCPIRP